MKDPKDDQILKLYRNAPHKAFSLLWDQYYEKLYWHIRSIVLYHQDAHDVSQNCLMKIYQNLKQFRGEASLYTWMYRIATNEALDFLRKEKIRRTENMEDHQEWVTDRSADAFVEHNQLVDLLVEALDRLPDKQKLVFQLRYFGGKPYSEIAEITGTSIGGLKANYHHAVQKIREHIKNEVIQ